MILEKYMQFTNINFFIVRGNYEYQTEGRIESKEIAEKIDYDILHILEKENIPYIKINNNDTHIMLNIIENTL